jgi:hypothetical protein
MGRQIKLFLTASRRIVFNSTSFPSTMNSDLDGSQCFLFFPMGARHNSIIHAVPASAG